MRWTVRSRLSPLRVLVQGALAATLAAWAVPTATLPAELEPYFAAIRQVESRGHPWSIFDNTARRSYQLASRAEAESKARELLAYGHNLDLGVMQLNCKYQCKRPGVSVDNIFDPEVNVSVARVVFIEFWEQARRVSTEFLSRVIAAVGAYNNGRVLLPNPGYVQKVWRQMGRPVAEIPNDGRGTPPGRVATAGDGIGGGTTMTPVPASRMDDALGRANQPSWSRDRLAAVTSDRRDTPQKDRPSEDRQRNSPSDQNVAEIGMGAALVGVFVIGSIGLFLCIKVFGLIKVLRVMRMVRAVAKRKDDQ